MSLMNWSSDVPAEVVDLGSQTDQEALILRYAGGDAESLGGVVLMNVLAHATQAGATTGVIEFRYVDPDWRSEHAQFYSTTFRRFPSVAHRLHFFKKSINAELLASEESDVDFETLDYVGYVVLRPLDAAPVGRTILPPRSSDTEHITCMTTEPVNLFGHRLEAKGAPFMAQDGQLCICAHTSVWVTSYYHHLTSGQNRRYLHGEIAGATPSAVGLARSAPSLGLSIFQLKELFTAIGLPPLVYGASTLPATMDVQALVCRYLNSGIPVTIAAENHTRVLVGYRRLDPDANGVREISYFANDDRQGPYVNVSGAELEAVRKNGLERASHGQSFILVPLPRKIYVAAEDAEEVGSSVLINAIESGSSDEAKELLRALYVDEDLTFRTSVLLSNVLKEEAGSRWPAKVALAYKRHPMSRYVYVVELQRRSLREAGQPSIVGEAIIDATDSMQLNTNVLAWRVAGELYRWWPDEDHRSLEACPPCPALVPLKPQASRHSGGG